MDHVWFCWNSCHDEKLGNLNEELPHSYLGTGR